MEDSKMIEQKYVNKIIADINEIRRICLNQCIPMFVTVYLPDRKKYLSDIVSPAVLGINIEPDRITEHLNVANGFHTVLPIDLMHGGTDGKEKDSQLDFAGMFDLSELPNRGEEDP